MKTCCIRCSAQGRKNVGDRREVLRGHIGRNYLKSLSVGGEVETERGTEDGEERRTGLYIPNQKFEHGVVIPRCLAPHNFARSPASSTFRSRIRWRSLHTRKFGLQPLSPGNPRPTFSHTRPPSPIWLRRLSERVSPHTLASCQPTNKITMSTTESLHKQCRTLESLFDNKLTAYSRLAATITRPGSHDLESTGSLERWQDLEVELEELLQKVRTVLD